MNDRVNRNYLNTSNIMMTHGKGIYLYDSNDKQYIDCAASTFNVNLGYSHPEVLASVKEQMDKLIHVSSTFQTEPVNDVINKLIEITPPNIRRVHLKVSSGSMANEGAIKMAQYTTGKRGIISFFRSHLGQSMMMTSISGNAFRKKDFPAYYPGVVNVPDPYCHRCFYKQKKENCNFLCVERINDFIEYSSCGKVACLITEPISGNGGNIIPPPGYFKALKKLCDQQEIVFICDEIQTGLGRTGKMFAFEHFGIRPNIITVAKGLGGIGFPIAAILTEDRFLGMKTHHHSFTNGSNTLASMAAITTLERIHNKDFLDNVTATGNLFIKRLHKMREKYDFIGDIRGLGLMIGFEIVNDKGEINVELTNHIVKYAETQGLLLRTSRYGFGNVIKIRPALNITMEETEMICDLLDRILGEI